MIVGVARARKDAKALSHAIKCETLSLGGIRKPEDIDPEIFENLRDKIPIFFAGRDDAEVGRFFVEELEKLNPLVRLVLLSKKAVRNTRMEEIREKFELEKAKIRLSFEFDGVFRFSKTDRLGIEVNPDYDAYFILSDEFAENMTEVFGADFAEGNLIVRKLMNEEWVYAPELKAIVSKKIGERCKLIAKFDVESRKVSVRNMAAKNAELLESLERVSLSFLRRNAESIAVPFSGGKDSLACLILACKAFEDVRAVYVRTNFELPHTESYVEEVCERLGVELEVVDVKFDGRPSFEDRWCTRAKMEALKRAVKKLGNPALAVGDREAESRLRRERPEIMHRVSKELFPIKYWSGCMVQLYAILNGISLHPLYYSGFYRLGCSICPSMSDWEHTLLKKLSFS